VIKRTLLIFHDYKKSKYSYNALAGALSADEYFRDLDIEFGTSGDEFFQLIDKGLSGHERVIIAFSFCTPDAYRIREVNEGVRHRRYPVFSVAGGPHPSGDPSGVIEMGFDIVVCGEGEETFPEVLMAIDRGTPFSQVRGIAYRDSQGIRFNEKREPVDLDLYPPFSEMHRRFGPIEITRGCPFGCHFCQTPRIFSGRQRHRGIEGIIKYVSILNAHGLRDIRFISPNFLSYGSHDGRSLNIDALEDLLVSIRGIIGSRGRIFAGSFPSEVRPEHVNEETMSLLRRYADNDSIVIGAQTGSQRLLDLTGRGHTVEDIYRAVRISRDRGFTPVVDFIFGFPQETDEDTRQTIRVIKDITEMGAIIHTHTFMPLPSTPLQGSQPTHINEALRLFIERLTSSRKAFGNWKEQERIARQI